MQTDCIFIASNLASLSPYWLQINFFKSLLFIYLLLLSICGTENVYVTADATAVFVNNQHGIQRWEQDFDKNFICNQYGERFAILNTENINICSLITKLEAIKVQFVCISTISAEYLQKMWIFSFPT